VSQAGYTGNQPGVLTDIWLPVMMFSAEGLRSPTQNWLQLWGRLAPGATPESVRPIARTVLANFLSEQRDAGTGAKAPRAKQAAASALEIADASTGFSAVRQQFAQALVALAVIVAVVLLIACSNVANLLLARGAARMREMSLRASIGAGRGRLLQQVLIESSVLTLAATVVGIVCATATVPLLLGMLTTNENPVYLNATLDWRILAFVAAIGCVTTMVFGLAPALRASAAQPSDAGVAGDRRSTANVGVARPVVAAQIGFSLMLLFVAVLLMRSFDRLQAIDLGFAPDRVMLLSIESRDRLEPAESTAVSQRLVERVRGLPGVEAASFSSWALFRGWSWGTDVGLPSGALAGTSRLAISSQFFRTMGTPLIAGRELEARDTEATRPQPVIVNAAFAAKYFPGEQALGRRLTSSARGQTVLMEIVGVAANARDGSVRDPVGAFLFCRLPTPAGRWKCGRRRTCGRSPTRSVARCRTCTRRCAWSTSHARRPSLATRCCASDCSPSCRASSRRWGWRSRPSGCTASRPTPWSAGRGRSASASRSARGRRRSSVRSSAAWAARWPSESWPASRAGSTSPGSSGRCCTKWSRSAPRASYCPSSVCSPWRWPRRGCRRAAPCASTRRSACGWNNRAADSWPNMR